MVSAGSDATGCQARACVTISAFVAPGRQRSMWRASVSTIQYSGTPSSLYSLRLCSRSVRLLDDLVAQMVVREAPNLLGGVSRHRVQWVRAEVRVDVPRACARGQCYNVYRRSRGLRTQTAPHGV